MLKSIIGEIWSIIDSGLPVQKSGLAGKWLKINSRKFLWKNVEQLIKFCQIHQYFPHQNFVPYGIWYNF